MNKSNELAAAMARAQGAIPGLFPTLDSEQAEALKNAGISAALARPGQERIRERIADYIRQLAESRMPFTSDSVYELADLEGAPLPDGLNIGAMFNAASRRGEIEPVWSPSIPSKRPASHARALKVWQGC